MRGQFRSIRGLAAIAALALNIVLTTAIAPPIEAAPEGQISFLDFVEQWEPKSPWHDQRVRLAASLAIDRKAINDAEALA